MASGLWPPDLPLASAGPTSGVPSEGVASAVAVLTIASEPPGGEVFIDGGVWRVASTPATLERFPWGQHHYLAVRKTERLAGRFEVNDYAHDLRIRFEQTLAEEERRLAEERRLNGPEPGTEWMLPMPDGAETAFRFCWVPRTVSPAWLALSKGRNTFYMASGSAGRHVQLTRGFWLGKFPVTQGQWEAVMGSNPSHFLQGRLLGFGGHTDPDRPVECITWDDCQAFCAALAMRFASRPGGELRFRLPTEAEWEYACRAGAGDLTYDEVDAMAWHSKNATWCTQRVGQKHPNAWGLCDMLGDVWEWCSDWSGAIPRDQTVDPTGPRLAPADLQRVVRGGCYDSPPAHCMPGFRGAASAGSCLCGIGFRLVCTQADPSG